MMSPGVEAKIQLFQNMVMLHIKLEGMMYAAKNMVAKLLPIDPSSTPGVGSKVKIFIFSLKIVTFHIISREWTIELYASTYFVLTHTLGFGQKVKTFFFSERSSVAYQIKGNGA